MTRELKSWSLKGPWLEANLMWSDGPEVRRAGSDVSDLPRGVQAEISKAWTAEVVKASDENWNALVRENDTTGADDQAAILGEVCKQAASTFKDDTSLPDETRDAARRILGLPVGK